MSKRLYWYLEYKTRTETRENVYIMTMVSRKPRQILGHVVSRDKMSRTIQRMVDTALEAEYYSKHPGIAVPFSLFDFL